MTTLLVGVGALLLATIVSALLDPGPGQLRNGRLHASREYRTCALKII
jgi:hypothetical protein